MIFGWIIGLVLSLVFLIINPDESIRGLMLIALAYFTLGLTIDCYKAQNRLPQESYQKQLRDLAKACAEENLEIRKQLLHHIRYMHDINIMCTEIIKENTDLKKSVLELTEILETATDSENSLNEIQDEKGIKKPDEKL